MNSRIYYGRAIGITGHRDIGEGKAWDVRAKMCEIVEATPKTMIFGGARGVDTIALEWAHYYREAVKSKTPSLIVIVPGKVKDQPTYAAKIIRKCADGIIEMGLDMANPKSYRERNERIVGMADLVVAFWNGIARGGTWHCKQTAQSSGVEVEEVRI